MTLLKKNLVTFSFTTIILLSSLIIFFNIIFSAIYGLSFFSQFLKYYLLTLVLIIPFTLIFSKQNNDTKILFYISLFFSLPVISIIFNLKVLFFFFLLWILVEFFVNNKLNRKLIYFKYKSLKFILFYLLIIFSIFFLIIFLYFPFFLNEEIINFYIPPSDIIIRTSLQELFKNFGVPTLGYNGIIFNPQIFYDTLFIGSINSIFNLYSFTSAYYISLLFPLTLSFFIFSKIIEKLSFKKSNHILFFKIFSFLIISFFLSDIESLFRIIQSSSTLYGVLFFLIILYSCIVLLKKDKNKFFIIGNIIFLNCILIYTKPLFGLFSSPIIVTSLILIKKDRFVTALISSIIFLIFLYFKIFAFKDLFNASEFYFNPKEFNSSSKITLIIIPFFIYFFLKIKKKIKYLIIHNKNIEILFCFISTIYFLSIIILHSSMQSLWINFLIIFFTPIIAIYFHERYDNFFNFKKFNYIYFFLISSVFLDMNKNLYIFVILFLILQYKEKFFNIKNNKILFNFTILLFMLISIFGVIKIEKNNIVNRVINGSNLKIDELVKISYCSKNNNCNLNNNLNFKDISKIIERNKKTELQIFIPQSNLEVWSQFDEKNCVIIQSIYQAKYGIPLLGGFRPKSDKCPKNGNPFIDIMAKNNLSINEENLCNFLNNKKNIIIIKNKQKAILKKCH